ncbi:MAG: glycosyltransferase, partial [Bacteroidales bacterium]|nr:glycosyltransferase [Bacteroidales bacterium]
MEKKPLKLLWLCHYSLEHLKGRIALDLEGYNAHPATWIHELGMAVLAEEETELHIITVSAQIPVDVIFHSGKFNVYAYSLASGKGVSGRWGKLLRLRARRRLQQKLRERIRKVSPDLITIHGTEHSFTHAALNTEAPIVLWMQGVMEVIYSGRPDKVARTLIAHEQSLFRSLRHFVTAQPYIHSLIRAMNPEAVFHPLFYPVNPAAFNRPVVTPVWDIAFSGTLIERKGVEDLLHALALVSREHPQITACLIGPPESEDYGRHLEQLAAGLGISDQVLFSGRLEDHLGVLD